MKVCYVNGYSNKVKKPNKIKKLEKILDNKIDWIQYDYKKNNIDEIQDSLKDYDIIIGSSTGALIARYSAYKYNIALISINPVIDVCDTFSKLGVPAPKIRTIDSKYSIQELVLLGKNDELIDYKKSEKLFRNTKVYNTDHRFSDIEKASEDIKLFVKFLYVP